VIGVFKFALSQERFLLFRLTDAGRAARCISAGGETCCLPLLAVHGSWKGPRPGRTTGTLRFGHPWRYEQNLQPKPLVGRGRPNTVKCSPVGHAPRRHVPGPLTPHPAGERLLRPLPLPGDPLQDGAPPGLQLALCLRHCLQFRARPAAQPWAEPHGIRRCGLPGYRVSTDYPGAISTQGQKFLAIGHQRREPWTWPRTACDAPALRLLAAESAHRAKRSLLDLEGEGPFDLIEFSGCCCTTCARQGAGNCWP